MSIATLLNTCQACGAEESLDSLLMRMIDDDETRRLIADVLTMSLPLGGLAVRYLKLHKPPTQRLRMTVVAKLLAELVPDMQRAVIERNGRGWAVTTEDWKGAFEAVFDAVQRGTLKVPVQGNGYLYTVLMRLADKGEAVAEQQREADRRTPVRQDTVNVRGQSLSIGEALKGVHAGKDPALVKLDDANRTAARMPDDVRARIAQLKKGQP